jgi:large subunit ribosomal protein L33
MEYAWSERARENRMREIITLQCSDCKRRNYTSTRNKKKQTERLEIKKYCPFCRKHTRHKEVR